MKKPVQVCLTADIEFVINGALTQPERHRPSGEGSVYRLCSGHEEGLPPLLEPLRRFGLPATFFVESLQCIYFGLDPMRRVVERLRQVSEMDLQLHVHPCWLNFSEADWPTRVKTHGTHDSMAGRGAELDGIIAQAQDFFYKLTGQQALALRTGNLSVDLDVYAAQAKNGIPLASSVGTALAPSPDAVLRQYGGLLRHEGVVEIPVTSFKALGPRGPMDKLLTLAGNSLWQIRNLLDWAYENQAGPIVVLTHASEMADSPGLVSPPVFAALRRNQRRWERLCEHLSRNPDRFNVCSFAQAWPQWQQRPAQAMNAYDAGFAAPVSQVLAKMGVIA